MHCDEIQQDLFPYVDGSLPPDRHTAVERHLSTCQACSEEAAAMKDAGDTLSRRLKQWADQGVCPPELMEQIAFSLGQARKKRWYTGWPAYVGAVAAAAVLVVVLTGRMDVSQQVASLPLVGTLAAQLLYPDADVHVDDVSAKRPEAAVAAVDHDGVTLEVYRVRMTTDGTRILYALRGQVLDTGANRDRFEAKLAGSKGALRLRTLHVVRDADEVLVDASYEPVLPGQTLTLTVINPPVKAAGDNGLAGIWQVAVKP